MSSAATRARVIELLRRDPLRHIVSLRMLTLLGEHVTPCLVEAQDGWALLLEFATDAIEYDARMYGRGRRVAVIDGTAELAQFALLEQLPNTDLVIKTHDANVARYALDALGATAVRAIVSFTLPEHAALHSPPARPLADAAARAEVVTSVRLDRELCDAFAQNGYAPPQLARHFSNGARCFALRGESGVAAACFVFQNFDSVWEIAGVYTRPGDRRQGRAARVVRAALNHLREYALTPRYQTDASNVASLALARHLGLVEFLRVEHLLLSRSAAREQSPRP